ncbi:hypothetical protein E2C01_016663 [Portunus trituberculatus]|uniref:Uncharacterized protein n=1 Tax=Portunus trituberculatus TaxID=210409 RepID=A0A5B7DR54_PORTR|nr:hypothetical protein [Portunus trituberculatus]
MWILRGSPLLWEDSKRSDGWLEGHGRDLPSVSATVWVGQAGYHHVGITDRLHLVHIVAANDLVKQRVQIVEESHHLEE